MTTPMEAYEGEIAKGQLEADAAQRQVMLRLDHIAAELRHHKGWQPAAGSRFTRWFRATDERVKGIPGLYLWGGVGRGKTHLCDLFFEHVGIERKRRLHFHHFMQQIHVGLREHRQQQDPLERIAEEWARTARLLLLDEMHVNDITDAMLLGGLLSALFRRGVTLVTTSNRPPDDLYKDGLQRARFLPAIAQIKQHAQVLEMGGETDFRLRHLESEPVYLVLDPSVPGGLDKAAGEQAMENHFRRLSAGQQPVAGQIDINGRYISYRGRSGDMAWFDFKNLCATPRSTNDYIELARRLHTIMVSDIPRMGATSSDEARRFVNMIDEFYERNVRLVVTAAAPVDQLYVGHLLAFEFERAASRLIEMRSRDYLAGSPGSGLSFGNIQSGLG